MAERVLEKILYAILSLTKKKTRREYVNIISTDGIPVVPQLFDADQRAQLDASGINYEIMGRRRGARRRVAVDDQVYQNLQAPAPAQNIRVIEIPEDYDFDALIKEELILILKNYLVSKLKKLSLELKKQKRWDTDDYGLEELLSQKMFLLLNLNLQKLNFKKMGY